MDLPALGNPITPTSARSFSSRWIQRSGPARPRSARRGALVGRRGEARVAAAAARAARHQQPLAPHGEIAERLAGIAVAHHGAERHPDDGDPRPLAPWRLLPSPCCAALGVVVALVAEVEQRGERGIGLEEHASRRRRRRRRRVRPAGRRLSRRKLTQPAPPSPPLTKISISSMNIGVNDHRARTRSAGRRRGSGGGVVRMLM